jgi:hypothetical protein
MLSAATGIVMPHTVPLTPLSTKDRALNLVATDLVVGDPARAVRDGLSEIIWCYRHGSDEAQPLQLSQVLSLVRGCERTATSSHMVALHCQNGDPSGISFSFMGDKISSAQLFWAESSVADQPNLEDGH